MPSVDILLTSTSDAICAVQAFAHVEHRLVLGAFAAGVEVVLAADLRSADRADRQQLREALR